MKNITKKPIGIIGGMGPYASAYFYTLLLKKSREFYMGNQNNKDYPEIIIDSIPVPDFISRMENFNIAKQILIDRVKKVNQFGVSEIGMVCNTAHLLYGDLKKVSKAKFISMIEAVAQELTNRSFKKVGILATPTTVRTDLYGSTLRQRGIDYVYASEEIQKVHEMIIRLLVAGNKQVVDVKNLETITRKFISKYRLDGVVLACTELPLVFPKEKFALEIIDCLDVLANSLLIRYYQKEEI